MKKLLIFFLLFLFLLCIPVAGGIGYVLWEVYGTDSSEFQKSRIQEILSKETVLYYADGNTQLGSLFGQEHRIYVTIDRIPQVIKDAIVSSEDEDFYNNIGIDPKGILRTFIHNFIFGTRHGASTITQQTVKNLFGRKEVNYAVKFQEMINAFKLENYYSKEQILEFYLNQFHVTGNGRGIGVAAKYYFNKNVEDLNLIEAAFIAGSVKAPFRYNPFTKLSTAGQERARKESFLRKNYVLERMYSNQKITKEVYEAALKEQVPFRQGRFQFNELALNQIVLKQLARPEVLAAVGANSADEIGTMGLHITTTIDKRTQAAAQYGLRQNLSRTQLSLNGFTPESETRFTNIQQPELLGFYVGKIIKIDSTTPEFTSLQVSFGLPSCTIPSDSLDRVALALDLPFRKGLKKSKQELMEQLKEGEYILASIKSIGADGKMICDLEARPRVQGAAIVLDKGQIIAMAGGFSSSEYNRALYAQRQPGSSFKTPTYYAAEQLGWNVLDTLPNLRDVYVWQGHFYFPRPDHVPKTIETTFLGAGAASENLASIWVLRHLLDKLTYDQFVNLIHFLGFGSANEEPGLTYLQLKRKFNLASASDLDIKRGILDRIKSDFIANSPIPLTDKLKVFLYTLHYGPELDKAEAEIWADKGLSQKERGVRLNALKNNLARWNALALQAKASLDALKRSLDGGKIAFDSDRKLISLLSKASDNSLVFQTPNPWRPEVTSIRVGGSIRSSSPSPESLLAIVKSNPSLLNNVWLDGIVPLTLLNKINSELAQRQANIGGQSDFQKLFFNADFRYSIALYYAAHMVNSAGIQEPMQWVPSFPLGSNVITLANLALLYQTFLRGKVYRYFNTEQTNQFLIINNIQDAQGHVLWQAKVQEAQFADPLYSAPTLDILRGTVTGGTGFVLNQKVVLRSDDPAVDKQLEAAHIRVPVFGKTGTTNNFTNGTYIGFLPYPPAAGQPLTADNAYTIATYIGYDGNEPMVHRGFRVYGGNSIPAWEEVSRSIIMSQDYADKLDWKNLVAQKAHVIPFNFGPNLTQVIVPFNSGKPISTLAMSSTTPADTSDDDSPEQTDPYADDYSETGASQFKVYLPNGGDSSSFVPKRLVSFYNSKPFAGANAPLKSADQTSNQTSNKSSDQEGAGAVGQGDVDGNAVGEDELPPPPPELAVPKGQ